MKPEARMTKSEKPNECVRTAVLQRSRILFKFLSSKVPQQSDFDLRTFP